MSRSLRRVLALPVPGLEIIVVDGGSRDATGAIVSDLARLHPNLRLLHRDRNRGKGAAVRSGLDRARGQVAVIQDADVEYDPADLLSMLRLFESPGADVVYGFRALQTSVADASAGVRLDHAARQAGRRLITWLSVSRRPDEPVARTTRPAAAIPGGPMDGR